jgi:hypothetical protein
VRHQWQRHADKVRGKVAACEHARLVMMVLHGWAVDASAGVAAAGIGDGTVSTASEAGAGEP